MKLYHHYHHRKLHSSTHADFWNFELSVWLHMVGYSIINIFIPILMLVAGYSIAAVIGYVAVYSLLDVPLNYLARALTLRFGARMVVIAGTLSAIIFFILFPYLYTKSFFLLVALAFLAAVYDAFYWVAHLYLFIESSGKKENISRNNGLMNSVRSFGGMLGPAIGAGILLFTNQFALIIISIIFLTASIIPLLFLRHTKDKPRPAPLSHRKFFKELPERKSFLSWFLYSVHAGVDAWIWPIFIFTLFGTLRSIALVAIIISVSKIILSYASGLATSKNREKLIVVGTFCILVVWILRLMYVNNTFYYLSILLVGLFTVFIEVPLDSNIFERARLKDQSLAASTYRNAIIMFPQGLLFAVLAILVGVFKVSFLSAIVSLILLLLVNQLIIRFSPYYKA